MRDLPTGTITLLFTDIEGSTHLLQQLGAHYAELLAEFRNLLRTALHAYRGQEVDTQGDAVFAAFARASDALSAAVAAQRELALHSWPDAAVVRVRMGLHTGEPTRVAEGYVGLDVHYAARIMSAGHGDRSRPAMVALTTSQCSRPRLLDESSKWRLLGNSCAARMCAS